MVCRQNPQQLDEVLLLLESDRTALRASQPRERLDVDPDADQISTFYYRMPAEMAQDLIALIPELIAHTSWAGENATGSIRKSASKAQVDTAPPPAPTAVGKAAPGATPMTLPTLVTPQAVLIIRQTKAIHTEIQTLIRHIQTGYEPTPQNSIDSGKQWSGSGGQQGGFGGSFFLQQLPSATIQN